MKRILLLVTLVASSMLGFGLQSGHAITNGVEGTDPYDDVLTSIEALRHRGLYAKQRPMVPAFDINNWKFQTLNNNGQRRIVMQIKTEAPWPQPGALLTTPEGQFPPGTTDMDIRWVYQFDETTPNVQNTRQLIGQSCTGMHETVTNPLNEDDKWHPISYDKQYCFNVTQGPFHPIDGWSYFIGVEVRRASGKVKYDWTYGRYGTVALTAFGFNRASLDHDQLSCWDVNLNNGQGGTKPTGDCEPDANAPAHGDLVVDRVNNIITLTVPYILRTDLDDDEDGMADETRSVQYMRAGDNVRTAQVHTAGTVSVSVPPDEVKPCYREIFAPIKDATGEDLQARLPAPFNDPNACLQTGHGLTFTADWAPGNPFQSSGIPSPLPSALGDICVGTQCNPDWGSFMPRVFPRAPSYYAGLNTPFCRHPTIYPVTINMFSGVTVSTNEPLLQGLTVDPPPDGDGTHIPAILEDGSDTNVPLPTGSDDPCYHIRDNNGLFFINWGGSFSAA